jgi:Ca2+-binding RTX toxin-like protein
MPVEGRHIAVIGLGDGEFKVVSVSDGLEIERHDEITGRIVVRGNEGPDHVVFTFFPFQAHDVVFCGHGGDDFLISGAGNDFADGGEGKDILVTLRGDDELRGGPHNDLLYAGIGDDSLCGDEGHDKLFAGPGDDIARGGEGNDKVFGGFGHDILLGNEGNDTLWGEFGRDILIGGDGADKVVGGAEDDIVFGGTTAYDAKSDANDESLRLLLAEWTSLRRLNQRVVNLMAGTGNTQGTTLNPGVTLFDDEFVDGLVDQFGGNWFIRGANPRDFAFGAFGGRTTWI